MATRYTDDLQALTFEQKFEVLDKLIKALGYAVIVESTPDYKSASLAKKCSACNGSGHYDAKGSPLCSHCRGLGWKEIS